METPEIIQHEIALISRQDTVECAAYFRDHKPSRDGIAFLISTRNFELILACARYRSFDSFNEVALVRLHNEELVIGYLKLRMFLWTDAEVEVIECKMTAAIRLLMQNFALSGKGEVALLKSADRALINEYDTKWGFRSKEGKNLWIKIR